MTCYNPYDWKIEVNNKIWSQCEMSFGDYEINGWSMFSNGVFHFVENNDNVKERIREISYSK